MLNFNNEKQSSVPAKSSPDFPSVAGVIMVRDQEKYIEQAIDSLSTYCDIVYVIDTGSVDDTIKIINKMANKCSKKITLRKIKWNEDFGLMRNKCLEGIQEKWIFSLDADEKIISEISSEYFRSALYQVSAQNIRKDIIITVKQTIPGHDVFVRPQRIFTRTENVFYSGLVHEEIRTRNEMNIVEIDSNLVVQNHGESKSEIVKFKKKERYLNSLLKMIDIEPDNPRWASLVVPDYITHGIISATNYELITLKAMLVSPEKGISVANLRKTKYLRVLFENYSLFLIAYDRPNTESFIAMAQSIFPTDTNFETFLLSRQLAVIDVETKKILNASLSRIKKMNSTNTPESIDEASQGSEEYLAIPLVKLLKRLGRVDESNKIIADLDDPNVIDIVKNDTDIMN